MGRKFKTINGYDIKWNSQYEKWQVCKGEIVLEEFTKEDKAIQFAKGN